MGQAGRVDPAGLTMGQGALRLLRPVTVVPAVHRLRRGMAVRAALRRWTETAPCAAREDSGLAGLVPVTATRP